MELVVFVAAAAMVLGARWASSSALIPCTPR